jgi:hypothetical protein
MFTMVDCLTIVQTLTKCEDVPQATRAEARSFACFGESMLPPAGAGTSGSFDDSSSSPQLTWMNNGFSR